MTFDFGEVLTRAWKITWGHKILWVFGLISMLLGLLFLPLAFAPSVSIFMSDDVPVWIEEPAYMFGFIGIFIILMLVSFIVGAITQAAIAVGVLNAERDGGKSSFGEVLKASVPFFKRFLGIMLIYAGGILLVVFAVFALQMFISMATFGLGAICMVPLQFLMYPLMFIAYAWLEQALASIVVDDLGVFAAVRRGWQVFRKNLLPVALMTLIMYLGIGILTGFVYIPLMLPLFAMPFVMVEGIENSRVILLVASLCMVIYLPILAAFQSIALTFMKSGWILTYLRLTRKPESPEVPVFAEPHA